MNSLYLPGSEATCMVERTKLAALCVGLVVKTGMGSAPSTLLSGQGGERPGTPPLHHAPRAPPCEGGAPAGARGPGREQPRGPGKCGGRKFPAGPCGQDTKLSRKKWGYSQDGPNRPLSHRVPAGFQSPPLFFGLWFPLTGGGATAS